MALGVGLFLPRVYVFLISSGGFALLFTYCFIMATHIRFRKKQGCPPDGKCQMWGAPYTSAFVLLALLAAIGAMPFVPGQTPGLIAGGAAVVFFTACYWVMKVMKKSNKGKTRPWSKPKPGFSTEIAREFTDEDRPGKDKA
jgi:L-asparagine transporter-like permease